MPEQAGFPNLARGEKTPELIAEVTAITDAELTAAGIRVVHLPESMTKGEVPSRSFGELSMWGFQRRWYYWAAQGPGIPPDIAEKLHAEFGTQVRVDGHCGCPSPLEWNHGFGTGSYHVDTPAGLKALADVLRSIYDEVADPNSVLNRMKTGR